MTRPERDRSDASPSAAAGAAPSDERFWEAFAQAAGFDEELRELIASGELDAAELEATEDATPEDLLAADRFHDLLQATRPVPVERAPQPTRFRSWIAAGALAAIGTAAAVAAVVWLGQGPTSSDDSNQEVASVELAESWIAVRESSDEADAIYVEDESDSEDAAEFVAATFDETPDWLALAVAGEAELATDAVEEGTP
jgi:hypothetical protein